jgi:hypothetical protein
VSLPIPAHVTAQDVDAPLEPTEVASALPAASGAPEHQYAEFFALLQKALSAPVYEYDGPFPVGGPTGTYHFANNFATQCEVTLAFVTFLGGAGFYSVSENEPITPVATSSYGTDPYTSKRGWIISSNAAQTIYASDQMWMPMQPLGQLGINVALATGSAIGHFYTRRRVLPSGAPAQSIR